MEKDLDALNFASNGTDRYESFWLTIAESGRLILPPMIEYNNSGCIESFSLSGKFAKKPETSSIFLFVSTPSSKSLSLKPEEFIPALNPKVAAGTD